MKKLILMSILIATFAIPFVYATRPLPPLRTTRTIRQRFLVFCVLYVISVCYVMARL